MKKLYFVLTLAILAFSGSICVAQIGVINTYVTTPFANDLSCMVRDSTGNIYGTIPGSNEIIKINPSGVVSVFAGTGVAGYSGDGGLAINAQFNGPTSIAIDRACNIYVMDDANFVVRKINTSGIITTIAGNGLEASGSGNYGDGGPATAAEFEQCLGIAVDTTGNVYIVDEFWSVVRKINTAGIISTFAGIPNPDTGFSGDGGPATAALFHYPVAITIDPQQNVYILDEGNNRVRKINTAGIVTTIAGNGIFGYTGNGGPGDSAEIGQSIGISSDVIGNIYIADNYFNVIRKINPSGIITTIAGSVGGYYGDGGLATLASFNSPTALVFDKNNSMYITDNGNLAIRKITFTPNVTADSFSISYDNLCSGISISTVTSDSAATGLISYFGDGTSDTTSLMAGGSGIQYISATHSYPAPGTYTIKEVLMNGTTGVDSAHFSYQYLLCNTFSVKFYLDANGNCVKDANELFNTQPVTVEIDSNGVAIGNISATGGFYYTAYGLPGDVYAFKLISAGAGLVPTCSGSGIVTDTLNSIAYNVTTNYVGLSCSGSSSFDLTVLGGIDAGRHFGMGNILVSNNYCTPENAVVTMTFSPQYVFLTSTPAPDSVSGNVVTWDLSNVSVATGAQNIHFALAIPGSTWLSPGDTIQSSYRVTPTTGDVDTSNNIYYAVNTVNSSFDPNEMSVTPSDYILPGTTLQYRINFENTGNDTAFNIAVLDTLPANVNVQSLRIDGASATMNTSVFNSGGLNIVKFDFPGINLLDSSHHNQCNGMVVFHIKTNSSMTDGTSLANHAGIFFDDNPVVMTDTVNNTVSLIHGSANVCVGSNITPIELATGGTWALSNGYATGSAGVVTGVNAGVDILTYTLTTRYETLFTTRTLTVDPSPAIYAVSGGGSLCAGATGVSIGLANSDTTATYQPYIGTTAIGTAVAGTGSALSLGLETTAGIYTVMATSIAASCTSHMSGGAEVFVYPIVTPYVSFTANPSSTVCSGSPLSFVATEINGGTYPAFQWRVNGVNTATGSTYTYIPTFGDVVTTVLTSDALCTSVDTALSNMSITVDTTFTPTISLSSSRGSSIASGQADTLTAAIVNAGTSPTFQWYVNSTSIPGAITNTLIRTFTTSDSVSCIVNGEAPCGTSSAAYFKISVITNESVAQVSSTDDQITLMPNPNSGSFTIKGTWGANNEKVSAEIIDMLGQVIYKNDFTPTNGNINEQIQLSKSLPNGMYTLSLHSAGNSKVLHFVLAP